MRILMNILKTLLVIVVVLIFPRTALSHQISPCYRVLTYGDHGPSEEPIRLIGYLCGMIMSRQERSAVHEHLTAATIREYRNGTKKSSELDWKWQYMGERSWPEKDPKHNSFAIIFGTWWNDDPLMLTLGQGMDFTWGGYKVWSSIFGWRRSTYPGALKRCDVPAEMHLGRVSHLGDLQHLHFMTTIDHQVHDNAELRVDETIRLALEWLEFAYGVATGKTPPDSFLSIEDQKRLHLPSIAENHCVKASNVKVNVLFSGTRRDSEERNLRTPDLALGSMLHILQDSFSPAHTCRFPIMQGNKLNAVLREVYNYNHQDEKKHADLDGYPQWFLHQLRSGERVFENDPVAVGSWLIGAVDQDLPWSQVKEHLLSTIFAKAPIDNFNEKPLCIEQRE